MQKVFKVRSYASVPQVKINFIYLVGFFRKTFLLNVINPLIELENLFFNYTLVVNYYN